jgi:hypothetical protein
LLQSLKLTPLVGTSRAYAAGKVRFVPKMKGLRPIVNLAAKTVPLSRQSSIEPPAAAIAPATQGLKRSHSADTTMKRSHSVDTVTGATQGPASPPATKVARTVAAMSVNSSLAGVHDVSVIALPLFYVVVMPCA